MTPLTDDELERHLARRLAGPGLEGEPRHELLAAISGHARATPRHRLAPVWPQLRWLGVGATAMALAVVAMLAIAPALAPPGPLASPSPSAPGNLPVVRVLTGAELAALAHDTDQVGRVVVAKVDLITLSCSGGCPPRTTLMADSSVAVGGLLDAAPSEVAAFRVERQSVVRLGSVELDGDALTWSVYGILGRAATEFADHLLAVDGWLVQTPVHFCGGEFNLDERFSCGRKAYITPDEVQIASRRPGGGLSIRGPGDHSLRVQNNAYDDFAPSPEMDSIGITEPRRGTYLVRWAGCANGPQPTQQVWQPPTVAPSCSFWELVGRVDPLSVSPSISLSPSPSPTPLELTVYTEAEATELATDPANEGRVVIVAVDGGFLAVRSEGGTVQVGSVTLVAGGAWSVADVRAYRGGQDLGLIPVRGWLVETSAECPAPPQIFDDDPTNDDLSYYCGGSWLSDERIYTRTPIGADGYTGIMEVPGALHVQAGAYHDFAPDPTWGERGAEPRQGIYLVKQADCPAVVTGDCPVWEMVARLEPWAPVRASPTSGTRLVISGEHVERCGSVGGCAYLADLTGAGEQWLGAPLEFVNGTTMSIASGLPETLAPGDYSISFRIHFLSDAIVVGQPRPLGPLMGSCTSDFTVSEGQVGVSIAVRFIAKTCEVTIAGGVSQEAILGAVAEWLAGQEWPFDDFVYVHATVDEVGFLLNTYGPGARDPDLRDAGSPLFEGPMTDATIEAVRSALQPITAEFISDPTDIREPSTQPGVCEPFAGGGYLIQLGPPRSNAAGDGYFVTIRVGNGCYFWTKVVEVTEVDGQYRVTRLVLDGFFIVD
jgi:hypothetical protein